MALSILCPVLDLHAPGFGPELLDYVLGGDSFPAIDSDRLGGWRGELVASGELRRYTERLRTLYTTGENPQGTYLACPLCPMASCGVGLDTPEAADASCAHVLDHLSSFRRQRDSSAMVAVGV
jgi:hypothetical protein